MTNQCTRLITLTLTEAHLHKMVHDRLLKEDEIADQSKVAGVVQKLLDNALGLLNAPWHEWDDWAKGLE